jgi:hypothetical protein
VDAPAQRSDEESSSEDSDDGLDGTEHYTAVGYVNTFSVSFVANFVVEKANFENQTKLPLDPNTPVPKSVGKPYSMTTMKMMKMGAKTGRTRDLIRLQKVWKRRKASALRTPIPSTST